MIRQIEELLNKLDEFFNKLSDLALKSIEKVDVEALSEEEYLSKKNKRAETLKQINNVLVQINILKEKTSKINQVGNNEIVKSALNLLNEAIDDEKVVNTLNDTFNKDTENIKTRLTKELYIELQEFINYIKSKCKLDTTVNDISLKDIVTGLEELLQTDEVLKQDKSLDEDIIKNYSSLLIDLVNAKEEEKESIINQLRTMGLSIDDAMKALNLSIKTRLSAGLKQDNIDLSSVESSITVLEMTRLQMIVEGYDIPESVLWNSYDNIDEKVLDEYINRVISISGNPIISIKKKDTKVEEIVTEPVIADANDSLTEFQSSKAAFELYCASLRKDKLSNIYNTSKRI